MSRVYLGVLCGLVFGGLDTALMIPLSFPDKRHTQCGQVLPSGQATLPWGDHPAGHRWR